MEKYGFVYIWYDVWRKMYYIGCRWGTIDDGYICSSNRMRDAYRRRPQDFKRRILTKVYTNRLDLLEKEHKWLSKIKPEELGKKYYNIQNHHFGHWANNSDKSLTIKEKISNTIKELYNDPVYREKMIETYKKRPPLSPEAIAKRAKSNTGKKRSLETRENMKRLAKRGLDHHGYGTTISEETKEKIRQKLMGDKNPFYGKTHTKECRERMSTNISKSMKGKRPKNLVVLNRSFWWNNGSINKRTIECPGENWIKGQLR